MISNPRVEQDHQKLEQHLPSSAELITDPAELATLSTDRSGWIPDAKPCCAVRVHQTADVAAVLTFASAHGIPVVPRGAGTGLAGGAAATDGAIVLDLSGLNKIVEIDVANQLARVQAGVITADLDRAAREVGLWYAPDPASAELSTVGGNIATNAGGLRCVKYGVTREAVRGLEVVLADGSVVQLGRQTVKGVTGYDITGLMVGSEGTLGVITGATLALAPLPVGIATAVAVFDSTRSAAEAVQRVLAAGILPSLLELLDYSTLQALDEAHGTDWSVAGGAMVLVQADGSAATRDLGVIAGVLQATATRILRADEPDEAERLIALRRAALPAIERYGHVLIEDIAVPRSRLAEAVDRIALIGAHHAVRICTFAHAGDGNIHPIIVVEEEPGADGPLPSRFQDAANEIFELSLELGGVVSGEHGVGVLKRAWLEAELGGPVVALQQRIKAAFDPLGILNPGKAI